MPFDTRTTTEDFWVPHVLVIDHSGKSLGIVSSATPDILSVVFTIGICTVTPTSNNVRGNINPLLLGAVQPPGQDQSLCNVSPAIGSGSVTVTGGRRGGMLLSEKFCVEGRISFRYSSEFRISGLFGEDRGALGTCEGRVQSCTIVILMLHGEFFNQVTKRATSDQRVFIQFSRGFAEVGQKPRYREVWDDGLKRVLHTRQFTTERY